jgi:putative restriction endonuclease
MRYWWVNHKQTFRHEFSGGYIWSPKTKCGGALNRFNETMCEVAPGDIIFSYAGAVIRGFGIAKTNRYTAPRPDEFGHVGEVWDDIGWRVDVNFAPLSSPLRPSDRMQTLAPTLPKQYSPINAVAHGYQHVYLASMPRAMALMLGQLISPELLRLVEDTRTAEEPGMVDTELRGISEWEEAETKRILEAKTLLETTRKALIKARVGQALFRRNLAQFENHCRITGITYQAHLFASHINHGANPPTKRD